MLAYHLAFMHTLLMTEQNRSSERPGSYGRYIGIKLPGAATVEAQLQRRHATLIDIRDPSALPPPIDHFLLESHLGATDVPKLTGEIALDPANLDTSSDAWTKNFLDDAHGQLEDTYSVFALPHDPLSLYCVIADDAVVRITYATLHNQCAIQFNSIPAAEFDKDIIQLSETDSPSTPFTTLQRFSDVMVCTSDLLALIHGDGDFPPTFRLLEVSPTQDATIENTPPTERNRKLGLLALSSAQEPLKTPPPEEFIDSNTTTFNSLGGLNAAKKRLRELASIINHPDAARMYGVQPAGFLLHGVPGTGKTSLVEAFAHSIDAELRTVTSTEIIDAHIGASAKNLEEILEECIRSEAPIVLFFDEFETLATPGKAEYTRAYNEVQRLLQDFLSRSSEHPHIIVTAATNADPDTLAPALMRSGRLEPIPILLPDEKERADIWFTLLQAKRASFDTEWQDGQYHPDPNQFNPIQGLLQYNFETLAQQTEGMTGADFTSIIQEALMACYQTHIATKERPQVSQVLLEQAIREFHR